MTGTDDDHNGGEFSASCARDAALAGRLILIWLNSYDDEDIETTGMAFDRICDEVGDCAECWERIAKRAAFMAAIYMRHARGQDKAVADIQRAIASSLDGIQHHRDDTTGWLEDE